MMRPEWEDERLDAAFHARFDHRAPTNLAQDVHVRLAGTTPARFRLPRAGHPWSLAAAAVVVVLVAGTVFAGLGELGRTGGSPLPSDGSASAPGPSATPTSQAVPGFVFEQLPIVRVPDAIAVRDAGIDDREIAVLGWFEGGLTPGCPAPAVWPVSPLQVRCPDEFMWFMDRPESLIHRSGNETSMGGPIGPALNPDLDGIDRSWEPAGPRFDANGDSIPVDVVLVGHFDDRRAELCPRDEIDACRDRFVVDSVAIVHGVHQPVSKLHEARGAVSSEADIEAIVAGQAPDSPILSLTVVDGATGLAAVEPSLGTGQQGLIDQSILWVVRVLESGRVATYIVVDGSDAIYQMNPGGEAILVGGTPATPDPTASPGPWPPEGARVVVLTSQVGAGAPPVRVAVVDESGWLTAVSEKGAVDPGAVSFHGRFGAYAEPGNPGRVHLTWVGGICDSQVTVTVGAGVRSITFDMGPQPVDCDSIGVGRELVLDFTWSVDAGAIEFFEAGPAPPAAEERGYALDCGPLGPDTCQQKAEGIVALTPTQRVVSLVFLDRCGSYTATYDDGNGVTGMIDCMPGASPN